MPEVAACYNTSEEQIFSKFREKVRLAELLSASVSRLLEDLRFTGQLNIVLENGRVLKSGYQEGYFRTFRTSTTSIQ
jgi:hypothetical protein